MSGISEAPTATHTDRVVVGIEMVIHPAAEGGYWAEFPLFPGVYAEGETTEDLRRNAEETLGRYFELRIEENERDRESHEPLVDELGPIPSIPMSSDIAWRLPIPARVRAARAAANRRANAVLDRLPPDPEELDIEQIGRVRIGHPEGKS